MVVLQSFVHRLKPRKNNCPMTMGSKALFTECFLNTFVLLLFVYLLICAVSWQLLMCGTGNISVSDFRDNHDVVRSGRSFVKVKLVKSYCIFFYILLV